jgi:hypothetical protein
MIVKLKYTIAGHRESASYFSHEIPAAGQYLKLDPSILEEDSETVWLRVDRVLVVIKDLMVFAICSIAAAEVVAEIKIALGEA